MVRTYSIKFLFALIAFLLLFQPCSAQKNEDAAPLLDTIKLPTPEISVDRDCRLGFIGMVVSLVEDTNHRVSHINIYKKVENFLPTDTLKDTLTLTRRISIEELTKQRFRVLPKEEGYYTIKAIYSGIQKIESDFSRFLYVAQCSELIFKNELDKQKEKYFSPLKLVNVQIKEFNIFDRVGETVYTHQNNDIAWKGTFPNGQKCPNGIYYYYCEYIDIANNSEKKTLSGMIELKNN